MGIKKYCLLTTRISVLGGAELYVLRRAKYLKSKNIEVFIIVSDTIGDFSLRDEFSEFPVLCIPQLAKPLTFYSEQQKEKIYNKLDLFFGGNSKGIIFESNMMNMSRWSEYFAFHFNGKSIIYLVNDEKVYGTKFYLNRDYFEYKLKQREIIGLTKEFLSVIFGRKIEEEKNCYVNIGVKELADKTDQATDLSSYKADSFVIGTVGRLEKVYLPPLINDVLVFSKLYPKQKIKLLIVGGTSKPELFELIKQKYLRIKKHSNNSNVELVFLGPIFPISKELFSYFDVFVGEGTAAVNSISAGCATINMTSYGLSSDGIFGIDTFSFGYLFKNKTYRIYNKLDELYKSRDKLNDAKRLGYNLYKAEFDEDKCFKKMDLYIEDSIKNIDYYQLKYSLWNCLIDFTEYYLRKIYVLFGFVYLKAKIKGLYDKYKFRKTHHS